MTIETTPFEGLGLSPALLRALSDTQYTTPTPIQAQAIPAALAGHDILGAAQTGTGKTAAFGLPLLQKLAKETPAKGPRKPRALVLVPTRELAVQVADSLKAYGRHLRLNVTMIFGGVGMQPQVDNLRRGVDILVACPGRLLDHLDSGHAKLDAVEVLVLDEADRMLDMGFLPSIKRVLTRVPQQRQTMLFSATFEPRIRALAMDMMRNPTEVQVAAQNTIADTIVHRVHPVDASRKRDLLVDILAARHTDQVLVFGKTKHGCNRLAEQLEKAGLPALAIHGNKSQAQRQKALDQFKSGKARILVATDVAARGLDIPNLPLVINHDLPMVAEDYVHRIGRTGRNGASDEADPADAQGRHRDADGGRFRTQPPDPPRCADPEERRRRTAAQAVDGGASGPASGRAEAVRPSRPAQAGQPRPRQADGPWRACARRSQAAPPGRRSSASRTQR
jgi:ATP-dependent RNA helicase RhlE